MIRSFLLLCCLLLGQAPASNPGMNPDPEAPLEKSAYYAFVDHDFIFTIEVVKPGVPLLNFVSMINRDVSLPAKNVRLTLENRKAINKTFAVEAGDFQQPVTVITLTMHPRSSFGVRLIGDFEKATELYGATVRVGDENLSLIPLTSFDFESLVLKVNRLNLGSPDFSEDWQVLQLKKLGTRAPARRGER